MNIKPADMVFKPMEWRDDGDGGAYGNMHGRFARVEWFGTDSAPQWIIVHGSDDRGYTRGGRDGERTLDDIKKMVEDEIKHRITWQYEKALEVVRSVQKEHS